jgi:hypothetical protein
MATPNLLHTLIPEKPRGRSSVDLGWAAGFLEGEGSFITGHHPAVSAGQVQREPLERLQRLFGGTLVQRTTAGFSTKPIWIWRVPRYRSVEIMMTLFVLMSPKRQDEIARGLRYWKAARIFKRGDSGMCSRGHALAGDNLYISHGKHGRCRECRNEGKRRRRRGQIINV